MVGAVGISCLPDAGESWLRAATPMDAPCRSCRLTRVRAPADQKFYMKKVRYGVKQYHSEVRDPSESPHSPPGRLLRGVRRLRGPGQKVHPHLGHTFRGD